MVFERGRLGAMELNGVVVGEPSRVVQGVGHFGALAASPHRRWPATGSGCDFAWLARGGTVADPRRGRAPVVRLAGGKNPLRRGPSQL